MAHRDLGGQVSFPQGHVDFGARRELLSVGTHRRQESALAENRGAEIRHQPADRIDGMRDQGDGLPQTWLDSVQVFFLRIQRNHFQIQLYEDQVVADFVVEILGKPGSFLLIDLGYVCGSPMAAILRFRETRLHQRFLAGRPLTGVSRRDQQTDQRMEAGQRQQWRSTFRHIPMQIRKADLKQPVGRRYGVGQFGSSLCQTPAKLLNLLPECRIGARSEKIRKLCEIQGVAPEEVVWLKTKFSHLALPFREDYLGVSRQEIQCLGSGPLNSRMESSL